MVTTYSRALRRGLFGLVAVGVGSLIFAGTARADTPTGSASSAPPITDIGQAKVVDAPGVVLIQYQTSAYLIDDRGDEKFGTYDSGGGPLTTSAIGTGFFVSSNGYIVTAGHVAAPTANEVKFDLVTELFAEALDTGHCDSCDSDPSTNADDQFDHYTVSDLRTKITVYTQNLDLTTNPTGLNASLQQSSPDNENDTAVIKVDGSNFPVLVLGDSAAAKVGDTIAVIGYPSTAINNVDLSTLTSPTITQGTITNKPQQNGFDRIQSDATAEHGNSGGPMIGADGTVLGIVSNGETSTTNFFVPSAAVANVMREAGATNSLGSIDLLWRQGLVAFNAKHYKHAAELFAQCVALSPVHVGCKSFDQQATANFDKDVPIKSGGGSSSTGIIIGIVAGVAVLLGLVILMRRRRPATAVAAPPAPQFGAPPAAPPYAAPPPPAPTPQQWPASPPPPPTAAPESPPPPAVGPRFCPNCGAPMNGATTCTNCGYQA